MAEIYFEEKQSFNQWWIWLILIISAGIWLWGVIQQIIFNIPFGNNPASDLGLLLMGLVVALPIVLFLLAKMKTQVRSDGIYYKMTPFFGFRKIDKTQIESWYVRDYKPIEEYGGWGIRFSLKRSNGWAFNVSGKTGLQMELLSGKRILLGSRQPGDLKQAMMKLAPEKNLTK